MFLSKAEHQQAREALASGRGWERFNNQTIGGARCSVKLGVSLDGSWWLSVPGGNFEDRVVYGNTLADFYRQVGWSCPDCNAGVGGNPPCPVCVARARRSFREEISSWVLIKYDEPSSWYGHPGFPNLVVESYNTSDEFEVFEKRIAESLLM